MSKTRKKGNTGKRYTTAQRTKILNFVEKKGRGGISAAIKKFGVSYIAMRRWMKFGVAGSGKRGRPPGKAPKPGLDGRKLRSLKRALSTAKSLQRQASKLQKLLKKLGKK